MTARPQTDLPEEAYAAALASVPDLGPATLRSLLATEAPSVAWSRSALPGDVARIWQQHEEAGVDVCLATDAAYPERLHGDPEAPAVLFSRGDISALNRYPTVAIVGTRSPTRYGIGVAAHFAAELAAMGISVVSGLALGIDGAAHEGACAAGAPPVAVVAGGLSHPYPRQNARLWERVASLGVVLSESPVGIPTEKWRFPVRNRLLAALSDVVVVVESHHHGGALYTVHAAGDRGIPVGAVPGSIRSPASAGTNRLLAEGCFPVCDVADITMALSLTGAAIAPARSRTSSSVPTFEGADREIYDLLSQDPRPLDWLARRSGWDLPALCGALERLAAGRLAQDVGGWWERT